MMDPSRIGLHPRRPVTVGFSWHTAAADERRCAMWSFIVAFSGTKAGAVRELNLPIGRILRLEMSTDQVASVHTKLANWIPVAFESEDVSTCNPKEYGGRYEITEMAKSGMKIESALCMFPSDLFHWCSWW